MKIETKRDTSELVEAALAATSSFAQAHSIEIRELSDLEVAIALEEILFGTQDIFLAFSMRLITLEETRNRLLLELELWLRRRQRIPQIPVGDWTPAEAATAIERWLAAEDPTKTARESLRRWIRDHT